MAEGLGRGFLPVASQSQAREATAQGLQIQDLPHRTWGKWKTGNQSTCWAFPRAGSQSRLYHFPGHMTGTRFEASLLPGSRVCKAQVLPRGTWEAVPSTVPARCRVLQQGPSSPQPTG